MDWDIRTRSYTGRHVSAGPLMDRAFDRWLAAGYAVMVVFYVAASTFAVSDSWGYLAKVILNI